MTNNHTTSAGSEFSSGIIPDDVKRLLLDHPRTLFREALRQEDLATCLVKTAEIHGHYCPGIALGVMATCCGLDMYRKESDDSDGIMENILAIVETNGCFADGVQAVSGCTLGNNSLILRDLGKLAVTFAFREESQGIRIRVRPEYRAIIDSCAPEFYPLVDTVILKREGSLRDLTRFRDIAQDAAFALLRQPFGNLFVTETVRPSLPDRAPIGPSVYCCRCGEMVMETKTQQVNGEVVCLACTGIYPELEGRGILWRRADP